MESEGIIIRTTAYGDSDLILRVLSPESGKRVLMARGARKSNRRFIGGLEVFDHGLFLLKPGRGTMPLVSAYSPKSNFLPLREDLGKLSCATFLCELFDALNHEDGGDEHQSVFDLLRLGLESICESNSDKTCLRCTYLTMRALLDMSGFSPDFETLNASAHSLIRLIAHTESVISSELKSKAMLLELVESLRPETKKVAA